MFQQKDVNISPLEPEQHTIAAIIVPFNHKAFDVVKKIIAKHAYALPLVFRMYQSRRLFYVTVPSVAKQLISLTVGMKELNLKVDLLNAKKNSGTFWKMCAGVKQW